MGMSMISNIKNSECIYKFVTVLHGEHDSFLRKIMREVENENDDAVYRRFLQNSCLDK